MFDEVICASVRSAERPTIDCAALLKLAQLLSWVKQTRTDFVDSKPGHVCLMRAWVPAAPRPVLEEAGA